MPGGVRSNGTALKPKHNNGAVISGHHAWPVRH